MVVVGTGMPEEETYVARIKEEVVGSLSIDVCFEFIDTSRRCMDLSCLGQSC
jgi:UDP-N-acetyl-D-mannosaminuronic acid transferase (WecB/TagA/CpsF family)